MKKKLTILHVDDSVEWRDHVKSLAKTLGLKLISYASLEQAKAHSKHVDIYIVNGNMAGLDDGKEWAEKLSDEGKVVVFLASNADAHVELNLDKAEYSDKRWTIAHLVGHLR